MRKRFPKILGVAVTLAMLSSLIIAPMASALTAPTVVLTNTTISGESTYTVTFNVGAEMSTSDAYDLNDHSTNGTASWSAAEVGAGRYSVELYVPDNVNDRASVDVWCSPTPLGTFTNPTFKAHGVEYLGDDPWNNGPYLNIWLDLNDDGLWDDVLEGVIADFTGTTHTTGWEVMQGAEYYDSDDSLGTGYTDETDTQPFADWVSETALADADVIGFRISLGWSNHTKDGQTVTTYALEPDTITLTFPDDTAVPTTAALDTTPGTIQASPGWIDGAWVNSQTDYVTWTSDTEARTVTASIGGDDRIGEGAMVRIEIPGITNPSAIGDYNLTVKTSAETTAVTSAAYSVGAPTIGALPGVVQWFNAAGVQMSQSTSIKEALDDAGAGFTIKVGPGTYAEDLTTVSDTVTIEATGTAAETIITGSLTITDDEIMVDGLTMAGGVTVSALADDVTIENSVFSTAATLLATSGTDLVVDHGD